MKRLTSRKAVRESREKTAAATANGSMLPGEPPHEWKNRMRLAKKRGELPLEE
jgi:hypothetical protein